MCHGMKCRQILFLSELLSCGFQHWTQDQNCDIYFFLHLMTILLTLTSHYVFPLKMPSCLIILLSIID